MIAPLVAAALGAFGGKGPLTTAEVAGPEGLTLAYRHHSRAAEVTAGAERITWLFRVQDPSAPIEVTLTLESDDLCARAGALGVVGGPSLRFRQFVLP